MAPRENTVLIVDDQPANLQVLLVFLKSHDFLVRVADGGKRALRAIENDQPDLVLLDVMMPGVSGFETCRQIKHNKASSDIPVIFMTALDDVESKLTGFEVGGVDYITKPFQHAEVLARVNTHITLRRRELELKMALSEVKLLSGFLPICAYCKRIRDDKGNWQRVEEYISNHSEVEFSHGLCDECALEQYSDFIDENDLKKKE